MNSAKLVRKFLLPCGLCAPEPNCKKISMDESDKLVRPSELALYVKDEIKKPVEETRDPAHTFLEEGFGTIRKSLSQVLSQLAVYTGTISETIDTGIAHGQELLEYLHEESNMLPRIGAVGVGGLTGLIFALRGGKFKKLIYSSGGALTIASLCYPRQAEESWEYAQQYSKILYNFAYGIKPGDEKHSKIPWPDMSKLKPPSSFSELSDVASRAGSSVFASISSMYGKKTDSVDQKEKKASAEEKDKSK